MLSSLLVAVSAIFVSPWVYVIIGVLAIIFVVIGSVVVYFNRVLAIGFIGIGSIHVSSISIIIPPNLRCKEVHGVGVIVVILIPAIVAFYFLLLAFPCVVSVHVRQSFGQGFGGAMQCGGMVVYVGYRGQGPM